MANAGRRSAARVIIIVAAGSVLMKRSPGRRKQGICHSAPCRHCSGARSTVNECGTRYYEYPPPPLSLPRYQILKQGVEHGDECFCRGNDKGYKRLGRINNKHCDIECAGDPTNTCGGYNTIEVYKMKNLDYDENVSLPR